MKQNMRMAAAELVLVGGGRKRTIQCFAPMKAQPNSQREHKNDTQAKNGSYLLYHNSAGVNTTVTNIPEERFWSSGDFSMCSCCCLQKGMSFHLDFLLCAAVYSANQRCFSLCGRHTYQQMKIKRCATLEATVTLFWSS